jgi:hypothetical protein
VAQEFLNELSLSEEERVKLAKLGATPKALLSMRRASQDAFDDFVGRDRAEAIASELDKLLTDVDREALKSPPQSVGKLGARLEPLPWTKRQD